MGGVAEAYQEVATAFGYEYLGGSCDVTDLLADPGTLREQCWRRFNLRQPDGALSPCWWLTNPADAEVSDAMPRFLCKSLGMLRAERHPTRVATLGKIREEQRRRAAATPPCGTHPAGLNGAREEDDVATADEDDDRRSVLVSSSASSSSIPRARVV